MQHLELWNQLRHPGATCDDQSACPVLRLVCRDKHVLGAGVHSPPADLLMQVHLRPLLLCRLDVRCYAPLRRQDASLGLKDCLHDCTRSLSDFVSCKGAQIATVAWDQSGIHSP